MFAIDIDEKQLIIRMLGGFSITYGTSKFTEQTKRASKTRKLLQYLIAHRKKTVTQDELIETFCGDENMSDPSAAVRTMVYRVRTLLNEAGIPLADSLILAKDGGYAWNNSIDCTVDAEELEALAEKANAAASEQEKLPHLLSAIELYAGDFLPQSASDIWVLPIARWYRSIYSDCLHKAVSLLMSAGQNAQAEHLCLKALSLDPFDERILENHLKILIALGKKTEALDQYKKMEAMYYDILGVSFSENLRGLLSEISHPGSERGTALEAVLHSWIDGADFPGAYYCDLAVFKTIYQIEARAAPRLGRTAFIVRFDLKNEPGTKDGGIMQQFAKSIPASLRMGDLYTRSAPGQYMLMLHSLTYEDCKMLVDRILYSLDAKYLKKIIGTSIKPIVPISTEYGSGSGI